MDGWWCGQSQTRRLCNLNGDNLGVCAPKSNKELMTFKGKILIIAYYCAVSDSIHYVSTANVFVLSRPLSLSLSLE